MLKHDKPQKRMQPPPDITDLAARPPSEHKPTTQLAEVQQAHSSARQLPHPRYTNVAEPSDKRKVEVIRVKKSDITCNKNANIVKKRPASSSKQEPLTKNQCASGNTSSSSADGETTSVDPRMSAADAIDTAAENVWMCFACMLKLGVLKKRIENKDKHTSLMAVLQMSTAIL